MVTEQEIEAIGKTLVDPKQPLQARFRALFTLRGLGGPDAISWISRGFEDSSALLKHELAYCLGQMRDARAIPVLADVLQDTSQEPMVRHEAGEEGQPSAVFSSVPGAQMGAAQGYGQRTGVVSPAEILLLSWDLCQPVLQGLGMLSLCPKSSDDLSLHPGALAGVGGFRPGGPTS
jgi:hypothetical protein